MPTTERHTHEIPCRDPETCNFPDHWPSYPRRLPDDVEKAVYAILGSAWKMLAPYRTEDGPHEANNEIPAQFLVFMHTVQPNLAEEVASALQLMITGTDRVADECAPDCGHWRDWGKA